MCLLLSFYKNGKKNVVFSCVSKMMVVGRVEGLPEAQGETPFASVLENLSRQVGWMIA